MSLPVIDARQSEPDWSAADAHLADAGAVILRQAVSAELRHQLGVEAEAFLQRASQSVGLPDTRSESYNRFLGNKTVRLHGLIEKMPVSRQLIGDAGLLGWAHRALAPAKGAARLSAAEFIQVQPGEPRQPAHRDSDSWPLPLGPHPIVVNAIVALDDFTARNGATWVAPRSWSWPQDHAHSSSDFVQAVMQAGDAVLFRGDLVHGAGANDATTPRRAVSVSFCVSWLRPVENSFLSLSRETVKSLSAPLQAALGYAAHDGSATGSGLLGLYENGDPARYLNEAPAAD